MLAALRADDSEPEMRAAACRALSVVTPRSYDELRPLEASVNGVRQPYDNETLKLARLVASRFEPDSEDDRSAALAANFKDNISLQGACVFIAYVNAITALCETRDAKACIARAAKDPSLSPGRRMTLVDDACETRAGASEPECVRRRKAQESREGAMARRRAAQAEEYEFSKLDITSCRVRPRTVQACKDRCSEFARECQASRAACSEYRNSWGDLRLPRCDCPELDVHAACAPLHQFLARYPNSSRAADVRAALEGEDARAEAEVQERVRARQEAERQAAEDERQAERERKQQAAQSIQRKAAAQQCYQEFMRRCVQRFPTRTCQLQGIQNCTTFVDGEIVGP